MKKRKNHSLTDYSDRLRKLKFYNQEETEELFQKGYKVFDLLDSNDIEALRKVFYHYHKSTPEGFYASTHLSDKKLRKEISNKALEIIIDKVDRKFENINVLGGAFISKAPGEKGILPLHQDWNIVDEKKERSYNLWIPLQDVNQKNGAMRVLENSHTSLNTIRGPKSIPVLYSISDYVDQHMISLNMNSGEALIYDHALWHSSPVNQSKELRLALVMGVVCEGAQLRFYEQKSDSVMEYESHPLFFFENDREGGAGDLKFLSQINYRNDSLSKEEFDSIYLKNKKHTSIGIFQKIKSAFGI